MLSISKYLKSSFVKNSLVLTLGTALAQVVPMIVYPFLGRIYTPEDFALLASFTSIVSILSSFSSGKYENAIFLARTNSTALSLLILSIILTIFSSIVSFIIFQTNEAFFSKILGLSSLPKWTLLIIVTTIFINIFSSYNEWCVKKGYFKDLALNKFLNSFFMSSNKLFFGYTPLIPNGLIWGDIIGRFSTAAICSIRVCTNELMNIKTLTLKKIKLTAWNFKEFPLFNMPAQLLNTIASSFPIFTLNAFYSKNEVGYYAMAMSILQIPINVISLSVRDVFRRKANDIYIHNGDFKHFFTKVLIILTIISLLVSIILTPFLPFLFSFIIGNTWEVSGVYAQILVPMIVLDFIAISLSGSLLVTKRLKTIFCWQIVFVIFSILPLYLGGSLGYSITNTLVLFSIFRSTTYIILIILSLRSTNTPIK